MEWSSKFCNKVLAVLGHFYLAYPLVKWNGFILMVSDSRSVTKSIENNFPKNLFSKSCIWYKIRPMRVVRSHFRRNIVSMLC